MKHILFVDDDAAFVRQLQTMMQPLRGEWRVEFAAGLEEARETLIHANVDVVITDKSVAGSDGVHVLSMTRDYAPGAVRLILTDEVKEQSAFDWVGLAHQCLTKPCDAAALQNVVQRATHPEFAPRNERVMTLVAKLQHLPSLPTLYLQLVRLMNDPDAGLEQVGSLIGSDMAMTAKVLQLVNSSFFRLSRNITNPAEAVSFLGLDTLRSLVLAAGVFAQYDKRTSRDFSANAAARHSQQVGGAARAIAKAERAPGTLADQALVAGLLHDLGKLMLASNFPDEFQRALKSAVPLEAEREIFGANHAEIGGYLLGLWGLPAPVVEAIGFHHAPGESADQGFTALTAVHAGDCLVNAQTPASIGKGSPAADEGYLARLGLSGRLPAWHEAVEQRE